MRRLSLLLLVLSTLLAACGGLSDATPTVPAQGMVRIVPTSTVAPTQDVSAIFAIPADDPRATGNPLALVTIIDYSDFECPYCKVFERETMPQLRQQYVETGLVRFVYRDFLVDGHKSALVSAVAGRCAAQQGQFWPMHDKLFETHQVEWGGVPNRDLPVLIELAGGLGMDTEGFSACMADPAVEQAVLQEFQTAQRLGITGTPTFIINGRVLIGAQPLEAFQQAIAQAQAELR